MLRAGEDLVKIEKSEKEDKTPYMYIHLNKDKIQSVGKPAV